MAEGVTATVSNEGLLVESIASTSNIGCLKCLHLETQLQETLNELYTARLIIELIGNGDKYSASLALTETKGTMLSYVEQDQEEKSNKW
jgi:hypothetical protein